MGRYTPCGLEDSEDGGHPVQVALGHHRDDTLAAQPPRQQGSSHPVGARVEFPIRQLLLPVHRGDGIRVSGHPLLEQLVEPVVRQLPAWTGEFFELEVEFLGGEQALPRVLGVRIGGDERERGEVVTGDPDGAVRVERLGPVPQPQHEAAVALRKSHPQHGVTSDFAARAVRIEDGLDRRFGQAQLAPELIDRKVLVQQQIRHGSMGIQQQRPPRAGVGRQPTGQRLYRPPR